MTSMRKIKLKKEYFKWLDKGQRQDNCISFLDFLIENGLIDENKVNKFAEKLDY